MRRVTIAVIGNAKTTRANVEALIGDVVDSVDEARIVTVYKDTQSEGLIWATQYAQDKEIFSGAYTDNEYDSLFAEHSVEELKFFMLWDDEDPECQLAASVAQEHRIMAYDLTDGLILIPLNSAPISRPIQAPIPKAEEVIVETPVIEVLIEALEEEEDEEDDFFEPTYNMEEAMTMLMTEMGKIFAQSFTAEFKRLIKE
jgi:hypothetical protein